MKGSWGCIRVPVGKGQVTLLTPPNPSTQHPQEEAKQREEAEAEAARAAAEAEAEEEKAQAKLKEELVRRAQKVSRSEKYSNLFSRRLR